MGVVMGVVIGPRGVLNSVMNHQRDLYRWMYKTHIHHDGFQSCIKPKCHHPILRLPRGPWLTQSGWMLNYHRKSEERTGKKRSVTLTRRLQDQCHLLISMLERAMENITDLVYLSVPIAGVQNRAQTNKTLSISTHAFTLTSFCTEDLRFGCTCPEIVGCCYFLFYTLVLDASSSLVVPERSNIVVLSL